MENVNLKSKLPAIRAAMDKALADIAKAHGLTSLQAGKCTYDPAAGSFTFKVNGINEGGVSPEAKIYDQAAQMLELPARGAVFTVRGVQHEITGINSTLTKVLATNKDNGKTYLWKVKDVVAMIKRAAPVANLGANS